MQYSTLCGNKVARFGFGTKRMPTEDSKRVIRLDWDIARQLIDATDAAGMNYIDTSYSDHKGEAEAFLGEKLAENPETRHYVATSFFELVDPRYEYVFQKQLTKLGVDCIDYYYLEGTCDLTRTRDIETGAVDFLFAQKEAGKIANLGFSSELNAENLAIHLDAYPWDFVRMHVNYYDWFTRGGRECYETACEHDMPIVAHAALRTGNVSHLKPEALALLKEHNAERTSTEWALRFVKSLDKVCTLTCNMHAVEEIEQGAAIFSDDTVLSDDEIAVLAQVAELQRTKIPGA